MAPDHTCLFRHALALDERRVKFLPEYACGGAMTAENGGQSQPNSGDDLAHYDSEYPWAKSLLRNTTEKAGQPQSPEERRASPHIKEVWFPGTHSDM